MDRLDPNIYEFIKERVSDKNILLDEPMMKHTTFRVGGPAKAFVSVDTEKQLSEIIPFLIKVEEPYYVVGNGSNILVGDRGYNGVILEIGSKFNKITVNDNTITVQAGALMSSVARIALENGLTGFEFASGIPGTMGGGVVMNAGAYGGELKDVVKSVKVMTPEGELINLSGEDMKFGYRSSVIKTGPYIAIEITIELQKGNKDEIEEKMRSLNEQRRSKQPLEFPSAGSTFKRPEGYFAGKLIMDTGLRGFSIGGAAVSEKHCGFVINKKNATAIDIYEVITEVQERVYDKFGVHLEPEIIFLGTF